jgi:uncharacterized membrane protein YfcA
MTCNTSCIVASGLIFASLFTMFTPEKMSLQQKYESLLSEKQREKYHLIRKERLYIYLMGFVIGLMIAFGVVYYLKKSLFTNICLVGAIVFIFNYFFYVFYPKSSYMITDLDDKEDREAWLAIYKHMTMMYHVGFVFGVLGAMLLCYGIYKK